MAQWTITRSCGHEETVQIYGTDVHGQRQAKADQLARKPCRDCVEAARDHVAAAVNATLVPLAGSTKQIEWAGRIRADAVREIDTFRLEIGHRLGNDPSPANLALADSLSAALSAALDAHAAASWWIDNRHDAGRAIINEAKDASRPA